MSGTSNLELPTELKLRIERVAKDRNEEPATLLASAIDSLLNVEEAQIAEVRRRVFSSP
jgi:predicted transcriptional regulator